MCHSSSAQDLIDAVQAEGVVEKRELAGLEPVEGQAIRGREGLMTVWTL
jgi:hypothetical protein